jgi:hypothetical protein
LSPRRVLDQFILTDPLPTLALAARGLRGLKRSSPEKSRQKELV